MPPPPRYGWQRHLWARPNDFLVDRSWVCYYTATGRGQTCKFYINKPIWDGEEFKAKPMETIYKLIEQDQDSKKRALEEDPEEERPAQKKGSRCRQEAANVTAEAEAAGQLVTESADRKRKPVYLMNLDGPQRDYAAARETTKRNKAISAKAAEEVAELRRDRAQLLRLLGEAGVTGVDLSNDGDPEADAVDLGSLAGTLVKVDAGVVSESLLAKLIGVGLRAAEEQMQGEAAGLFPKLDAATVGLGWSKEEAEDAALGAAEMLLDGEEVDSEWAETSDEENEDELSEDGDDVEEANESALAASHGHSGVSKVEWARVRVAEVRAPVERQKQAGELRGALLHVRRLQAEVRSLKNKVLLKPAKLEAS